MLPRDVRADVVTLVRLPVGSLSSLSITLRACSLIPLCSTICIGSVAMLTIDNDVRRSFISSVQVLLGSQRQ